MIATIETSELPVSVLIRDQKKTFGPVFYAEGGTRYRITATARYDDQCGNGHNSFAITAEIDRKTGNGRWEEDSGGCCHEEVAKHFPQLAPLLKWHLTSSDGPMHYVANGLYWAGHCEAWMRDKTKSNSAPPNLEFLKSTILYGALSSDADFDLADHVHSDMRGFTWNEAKANALRDWLPTRLTALMTEFKTAVESLGLTY